MLCNLYCCLNSGRYQEIYKDFLYQINQGEILRPTAKALTWLAGNGGVMYGIVKMTPALFASAKQSFDYGSEGLISFSAGIMTAITVATVFDVGIFLSTEIAHHTGNLTRYFAEEIFTIEPIIRGAKKAVEAVKAKFCPHAQPAVEGAPGGARV